MLLIAVNLSESLQNVILVTINNNDERNQLQDQECQIFKQSLILHITFSTYSHRKFENYM